RIAAGGKTTLPAGTLDYEVNYGEAQFDARARRYTFETASSALRRNIDFVVDRSDPNYPRVTLTNRPTGESSLFPTQDMALNKVRFHALTGNDKDFVAKLDYEFDQKIGDTPVQWKVGGKFRGKHRKLDGEIADYAPNGTAPTQSSFTANFE